MADSRTPKPEKPKLLRPLSKSDPSYAPWILDQLEEIALLMGEGVTPERLRLTMRELLNVDPKELDRAFALARQELKFFPKPADIFELLRREHIEILHAPGTPEREEQDRRLGLRPSSEGGNLS